MKALINSRLVHISHLVGQQFVNQPYNKNIKYDWFECRMTYYNVLKYGLYCYILNNLTKRIYFKIKMIELFHLDSITLKRSILL